MSPSKSQLNRIIEHVVLYKAKPDASPSAIAAMLANLHRLASLDSVLHLSAGPITRCRSTSTSLTFTHVLHSRYRSKSDLSSYSRNPTHLSVVADYVRPVVDDVMAVDWVADGFSGSAVVPPGSAMRLTVLKVKEERERRGEVLRAVRENKGGFEEVTVGENFSPGRAKGYEVCSIAVLKGREEVEALDWRRELGEVIDGAVVVDYVVAAAARL